MKLHYCTPEVYLIAGKKGSPCLEDSVGVRFEFSGSVLRGIVESPAARRGQSRAVVVERFAEIAAPFLREHSVVFGVLRTNETLQADFPLC